MSSAVEKLQQYVSEAESELNSERLVHPSFVLKYKTYWIVIFTIFLIFFT